jgi:hypothetical protein
MTPRGFPGNPYSPKALDLAEAALGEIPPRSRFSTIPSIILVWKVWMVPTRRNVAMARRSRSASPGVKPAATMAIFIACSWNSGTPMRLAEHLLPAPCSGK